MGSVCIAYSSVGPITSKNGGRAVTLMGLIPLKCFSPVVCSTSTLRELPAPSLLACWGHKLDPVLLYNSWILGLYFWRMPIGSGRKLVVKVVFLFLSHPKRLFRAGLGLLQLRRHKLDMLLLIVRLEIAFCNGFAAEGQCRSFAPQ